MKVVRSQFKFPSNKLDYVAQKLGVGAKVQHSGFQLWLDCMAGIPKAWKMMKEYQIQDVNLLLDLYDILLPWIKNHPHVGVSQDKPKGCRNCGSIVRGLTVLKQAELEDTRNTNALNVALTIEAS
jgi:hypothetical protein